MFKITAFATALSLATIYYVSSQYGSDMNSCLRARSKSTPKRTVASAQRCLLPGDTIVVLN